MNSKQFEKEVKLRLQNISNEEVEQIRQEIDLQHDYELDKNGISHLVRKNLDTLVK